MTAASLEALARVLARLEPSVFTLDDSSLLGGVTLSAFNTCSAAYSKVIDGRGSFLVDDDRLFGAVRRCARERNMFLSIHESHNKKGFVRCNEWDGGESLEYIIDDQIGVALALAYCAACGEKVGGLAT